MKKALMMLAVFSSIAFVWCSSIADVQDDEYEEQEVQIAAVDTYSLKLRLYVPRIYDNTLSLGSRKYQTQTITGKMQLCYDKDGQLVDVKFSQLMNKNHKISGRNIVYTTALSYSPYPRFSAIGNNKTGKFNVASVCFGIEAEPSYNIGYMNEDNGLYLTLSGKGKLAKNKFKQASGYAAGTIGCGCSAYGHTSPTRRIGYHGATDVVDDVAAVHGRWSMKLEK